MTGEPMDAEPTKRQWVGYWSMIVQQTQNAFNDKMAQFILIPLGGAVGFAVESAAGIMIALPFVLFAPLAGWLSDRYSKRDVMLGTAIAQIIILAWICLSVWMGNMAMALIGFFGLAVQSAFFGPAKVGINKELLGSKHLGFASGIQQMMSMLAILIGQIVAGLWFDRRYTALGGQADQAYHAAMFPMIVLLISAVPTVVLSWIIPRVPAQGDTKFTRGLVLDHFKHLKDFWSYPGLRRAGLGVAFFWGIAAFINLWSVKLAKHLTDGGEGFGTMSSGFMASASLGMAAGFGFAAYLLRRRIELGWVPLGGFLMAVMSLMFLFMPFGGVVFMIALAVLAFASALFLAPLNAWLQDNYPANKRGEFQAAVNLLDCLTGIMAVVIIELFIWAGKRMGMDPGLVLRLQMGFAGVICAMATWGIVRILPADFLRLVSLSVIRLFSSRVRAVNADRMPKTGGVLLLPNHVSFLDAFLIAEACPRPVRFVMDELYSGKRSIEWFTRIFGTVLIRRDHPIEAIRRVISALKAGEVVCYFPEGQLTRTGGLSPLQRGFELIARKAGHPVVPAWIDGAWGSVTSYERGRFFSKVPYFGKLQVTVGFAEPMQPEDVNKHRVSCAMMKASAEAMAQRFDRAQWKRRKLSSNGQLAEQFDHLTKEQRNAAWINGHQLRMTNTLQPHEKIHVWSQDSVVLHLHGLLVGFAKQAHAHVVVEDKLEPHAGQVWVGGEALRQVMMANRHSVKIVFYDFSRHSLDPMQLDGLAQYPCLAIDGLVVAMNMPNPREVPAGFEPQAGNKPSSYGRLLPGWWIENDRVHGPAAPDQGLQLPKGCRLEEGFVMRN